MATKTKPRDLDLPTSFGEDRGGPGSYPTGRTRTKEDEKKYARYSRALWDEQNEYMAALQQVWTQNILFLTGRHWWGPDTKGIFKPKRVPSWREQPVTNFVLAFYRNFLAKALKNRPAWTVLPASTEPDDVHAAELGDQVLEAKWQENRIARVLRSAVSWTIATGTGILYPYWNSNTGRYVVSEAVLEVPVYDENGEIVGMEEQPVLLDKDGEPQLGPDGRPDPAASPHYVDEGDVGVRSYSPYQVRVNPEAEADEDLTWVIIADVRSIRELAVTNPDEIHDIKPEAVDLAGDVDRALLQFGNLTGEPGTRLSPAGDERDRDLDRVLVLHYHEKPSSEHPFGRYWVSAGDVLLVPEQDLPEGLWPPIVHLEDVVIPGRWYASSVLEQIIPLNKNYNEINAQIKEHHNLMAKGKWLVPRGSGIKPGMITNAPGEIIQFNPGFQPSQAQIASLPQSVIEERNRVFSDIEMVGGQHRVSFGKAPPGVSAGVAFLQLQEADDTDIGPFLAMLEDGVAQLAGGILQIIKERYTTERLIHVVGADKRYQVRSFKGADLRGVRDVRPQAGSSFPWSKTAQQSMLLTLAAQMPQLFMDRETGQFDNAKFAQLLPIGGLGNLGNESDIDVQEALREEEMFATYGVESNELPEVGFWQNHDIHYRQHVRVLKSATFRDWSPQGQQAFMEHVQQTMQARDQKAVQMAQMQAMAQGNAPKELYQQGGPQEPGAQAPPNLTEEDIANMSPDELAELDDMPSTPWLDEEFADLPPSPATRGGM
jgi:hypothetical protein